MTKVDLSEILFAMEACKDKERRYCREFSMLNPEHEKVRQMERDLILTGIDMAWQEIMRRYKEGYFTVPKRFSKT